MSYYTEFIFLIITIFHLCYANQTIFDDFHEELFIKPLAHNHVYSYFQFTTVWNTPIEKQSFDHCRLFPRPLGEILDRHGVQELHVSLTKGLWRTEIWGYPVKEAPPGAEIWAWFKPTTENVDNSWKELVGALSGLLCASLNFIDGSNTLSPQLSLRPLGLSPSDSPGVSSSLLRHASLPREVVCTENLTPWKKLLPCSTKAGLSTLLNSDHIYNTAYHSIALHFRPICIVEGSNSGTCPETGVELLQTVSLVHDLVMIGRGGGQWSIPRLFGQGVAPPCPLATSSRVLIDLTANQSGNSFLLRPAGFNVVKTTKGGATTLHAIYDLKAMNVTRVFNIETVNGKPYVYPVNQPPVLHASRFITGYGQEFGGLMTKIHNRYWKPIKVVFLENVPWFVPVYYHTLKVVSNGIEIHPLEARYIPGKDRVRPYHLELVLELPPRSLTSLSVQFQYSFLKWQEYPPDANHGFYMGAASLSALLPIASNYTGLSQTGSTIYDSLSPTRFPEGYPVRITTEVLIVSLPTPDFSMPYNVICLACTVVALAFGPLHNITTKRFVILKAGVKKGFWSGVFKYLAAFGKKLTESKTDPVPQPEDELKKKLD